MTVAATGVVNWRKQGIKYRKNELYIDVHEEVNMLTSAKGQVLRHDVSGKVLGGCTCEAAHPVLLRCCSIANSVACLNANSV